MTACDQPTAIPARRFRPHKLVAAIGAGAAVAALAAVLWIRGGATTADIGPNRQPASRPVPATAAADAPSDRRDSHASHIRFASASFKSLGIELVPRRIATGQRNDRL